MAAFLTNISPATVRQRLSDRAFASGVARSLTAPLPGGCGRRDRQESLCRIRLVLESLGILKAGYYQYSGRKIPDGKNGIKVLQRALGIKADGIWGPGTNRAVRAAVQNTLQQSIDTGKTARKHVVGGGGGGGGRRPEPKPRPPAKEEPVAMLKAGIPWIIPAGLATAGLVSFLMFKFGKNKGLSGCPCALHGHDDHLDGHDHDDEHVDHEEFGEEIGEALQAVKAIPSFPALRSAVAEAEMEA